jgi:hypothetical protein
VPGSRDDLVVKLELTVAVAVVALATAAALRGLRRR